MRDERQRAKRWRVPASERMKERSDLRVCGCRSEELESGRYCVLRIDQEKMRESVDLKCKRTNECHWTFVGTLDSCRPCI